MLKEKTVWDFQEWNLKAWTGSLHNPMSVIATVEKGVKYVQSYNKDIIVIVVDLVIYLFQVFLFLNLNSFL